MASYAYKRAGTASGSRKTRPTASFMPKLSQRPKVSAPVESSDEEAADEGAVERNDSSDDEDTLPPIADLAALKSSQSVSSRLKQTVLSSSSSSSSSDDDSDKGDKDDEDEAPVPSSARRRKPPVLQLDSDDDLIVLSPAKRQRTSRPRARVASSGSDSDAQPTKSPQKPARRLRAGKASQQPPPPSPSKRPQGHRTEKQKKMELLRRRRAGEKIDRLTSSESEDEDDNGGRRGLYDTDSEEELQALKEFEDDEEEEEEEAAEAPPLGSKKASKSKKSEKESRKKEKEKKKKEKAKKSRNAESGEERDSDMDSFIESDDSGPLGAPDVAMPLEFTAQAHKPLKEQFPYVVEWLVHNRINPAFARDDPVYRNAWRKLNDEYLGLASSKFSSSAWRPDFARTLRARPRIDAYEMDTTDDDRLLTCEACGRSKHPATWRLVFQGKPYSKETLQEIESDSSDSDDDDDEDDNDDNDDNASVDSQGHPLPAVTKQWVVGSTCKSNAETAHVLLHWKHALQEWVEDRLEQDGWMKAARVAERERLKPRRRRKLADSIVNGLRDGHVIAALYGDFKQNLEEARNKTTRGNGRWQ